MMPCIPNPQEHREKYPTASFRLPMMVARPVGRKEIQNHPDALEAESLEWTRLWNKKTWADEDTVEEWDDVVAWAQTSGTQIHLGNLFGIMVEKGSELMDIPDENGKLKKDPRRKYKYRVVFQGNKVVDENLYAAEFANLGSQPASMEASKMVDMYGCFAGNHM